MAQVGDERLAELDCVVEARPALLLSAPERRSMQLLTGAEGAVWAMTPGAAELNARAGWQRQARARAGWHGRRGPDGSRWHGRDGSCRDGVAETAAA